MPLETLSPVAETTLEYNETEREHCQRVSGWCYELATILRLPEKEKQAVVEAALLHHQPLQDFRESQSNLEEAGRFGQVGRAQEILEQLNGSAADKQSRAARLASIVRYASTFDEWLTQTSQESIPLHAALALAGDDTTYGKAISFVCSRLQKISPADLQQIIPKLPVYPVVALRLFSMLSGSRVSLPMLEEVAKSDQVLAGKLVKASNSSFYGSAVPICSVAEAIGYVGTEDARKIMLASALQPLLAPSEATQLWKHSLECAELAERIAEVAKGIDTGEAFLLGLLHDVGKLAMALLPGETSAAITRLQESGCSGSAAEAVLCGFDHTDAGAAVLTAWNFPSSAIDAVRFHSRPERSNSRMAAILYIAEVWTNDDREPYNEGRMKAALQMIGVSEEQLAAAKSKPRGALSSL